MDKKYNYENGERLWDPQWVKWVWRIGQEIHDVITKDKSGCSVFFPIDASTVSIRPTGNYGGCVHSWGTSIASKIQQADE